MYRPFFVYSQVFFNLAHAEFPSNSEIPSLGYELGFQSSVLQLLALPRDTFKDHTYNRFDYAPLQNIRLAPSLL
jgi:hypothetical protein